MRAGDDPVSRTTRGEPPLAGVADKGAALIELAMVLPLVVMLIVGMVSAGIAYNHQISLTHAAREGGRYGATLPIESFIQSPQPEPPLHMWLEDVINRTAANGTGSLDPGVLGLYICVAYVSPGTTPNDRTAHRVRDNSGTGAVVTGTDCFGSGAPFPDDRRVQVVVSRDAKFNALVFSVDITLDESAENRFEAGVGL